MELELSGAGKAKQCVGPEADQVQDLHSRYSFHVEGDFLPKPEVLAVVMIVVKISLLDIKKLDSICKNKIH